jgi:hypothetical protein
MAGACQVPHIVSVPNLYLPAMSRFTRDEDRYWRSRPADHTVAGLFVDGPQMTEPFTSQIAKLLRSTPPEPAESPLGARQRMARQRRERLTIHERRVHFLESVAGRQLPALRASRGH